MVHRSLLVIPRRQLPEGTVLVHNDAAPQKHVGINGFMAWTQRLDEGPELERCNCNWAGVNLRGFPHYRVRPLAGRDRVIGV
jgi:hypothetical protein